MNLKALMQKLETINSRQTLTESAEKEQTDKKKCPPMSHIKKMCQDGKSVAEICKMHPDCDHTELKQMIADCKETMDKDKKKTNEGIGFTSSIARSLIQEFGYSLDEAEEFQFSPEQEKFLGKANRQDPYILARMPGPKPPFSYFKDPEDQAIAKQMNFGANNLNKIKNLVGAGTQGDASTFAAAAPAKMRGGDPAAAAPQTGAASNMAQDPAQQAAATKPAGAPELVGTQNQAPDAAAQADRIANRMDQEAGANTMGQIAAPLPTGTVDPNAGELGNQTPSTRMPPAAAPAVSTQGAEASAKFKAEKLARLKEITAKLQAATSASKKESRLSEAEKYAALRDRLLMIETRVDEGPLDFAKGLYNTGKGMYQAAKTGFSGAPVATGKLTKAGSPQMTSQSSKKFAKQLATLPASQRAAYNTAKVVKANPIKTSIGAGLGAAAVAGGTAYALSGKPEETPAVVPAVQTGTPTPRKENPHADQGGTTPTPAAPGEDIKALTTEVDAIEKELMGDDGSAFQNDPEIQKAIADARAAAGGLAADPISKNALPKNESVDDELTRWLKIAHG